MFHPSGIARDHEKTTHQDILLQVAFKRRSQDPRLLFGDKLLLISLRPPRACEIHPQMLLYLYSTHRLMSTEVPTFAPMVTCRSWVSSFRAVRLLVLNRAKCATTIGKTRAKRHPSMQSRPRLMLFDSTLATLSYPFKIRVELCWYQLQAKHEVEPIDFLLVSNYVPRRINHITVTFLFSHPGKQP